MNGLHEPRTSDKATTTKNEARAQHTRRANKQGNSRMPRPSNGGTVAGTKRN